MFRGKHFSEATHFDERKIDDSKDDEHEISEFKKQQGFGYMSSFGTGIFQRISDVLHDFFSLKSSAPHHVKRFIDKHGRKIVKKIVIRRTPIQSYVEMLFNFISLGKWNKTKKNLKYDKVFHLFCVITLDDGTIFRLEKNQSVKITEGNSIEGEAINVNINSNHSFGEMMMNLEKLDGHFTWDYSPEEWNCQKFINDLLKANGLLTDGLSHFINQDAAALLESLPWFMKRISQMSTNIAGYIDRIRGEGKTTLQSVLFPKGKYTLAHAHHWLKMHNAKPIKGVHETEQYYRFRMTEPNKNATYHTQKIKNGIVFIFLKKK